MHGTEWELVLVLASDMQGMDDSRHEQFTSLIEKQLGPFLFQNVESNPILRTQMKEILQNGPKIVFVYDDAYLQRRPNPNFWPADFISSECFETGDVQKLVEEQGEKLKKHSQSDSSTKMFQLQWFLTPQDKEQAEITQATAESQGAECAPTKFRTPNVWLHYFVQTNYEHKINIIAVDFYEESDIVETCLP